MSGRRRSAEKRWVRRAVCLALPIGLWLARGTMPMAQMQGDRALDDIRKSADVDWLERIAGSGEFAAEMHRGSRFGMAKDLRSAAFVRLGELGTPASVAAAARVEAAAAKTSLTPATVSADVWPTVAWHMGDTRVVPFAQARGADGLTYAIVIAQLLGRPDYFLISSATPSDRRSWSRPKLVAPAEDWEPRRATLTWRGEGALSFSVGRATIDIVLSEVLRDSDGDGWTDREEERLGLNPQKRDTDGDGIPDGSDVCPLYPKSERPPSEDEIILQKAVFAAFGLTGSRQLLFVTPSAQKIHVSGYGGPILFDRPIPKDGSEGGPYVSWKIVSKTESEASVELTDWEGMLAAGGQNVRLRKLAGAWVVVARQSTWVS